MYMHKITAANAKSKTEGHINVVGFLVLRGCSQHGRKIMIKFFQPCMSRIQITLLGHSYINNSAQLPPLNIYHLETQKMFSFFIVNYSQMCFVWSKGCQNYQWIIKSNYKYISFTSPTLSLNLYLHTLILHYQFKTSLSSQSTGVSTLTHQSPGKVLVLFFIEVYSVLISAVQQCDSVTHIREL